MDEKNARLRELCEETDGFVQTTHLSRIIEDPVILKMAIDTLDKENTGKIPFQKLENLLQFSFSEPSDPVRSCSSSSDDPERTFNEYDYKSEGEGDILGFPQTPQKQNKKSTSRMRKPKIKYEDSSIQDLTQQVNLMKRQIFQIEEAEQLKSEQLENAKVENLMLRNKLLELEEFLRDVEQDRDRFRSENETLLRNTKKSFEKELSSKTEILELEKNQLLKNLETSKNELELAKSKNEKHKKEINELKEKVDEYQSKSAEQFEKYQKLTEKSCAERETLEEHTRVLEVALEELKLSLEKSAQEKHLLEEKLKIASQDSADIPVFQESPKNDSLVESLKNEIDDLKHELLSAQVTQARSLISAESSIKGSSSFAEELASCAEPGLKEKYETLEQTHEEVKKYLDKILTNVIERDPTLLMVNP
ncbi:Oidioi.mRNA.OKI2018_I69.chr1.g2616.t1.cds [Oikopleura dioica]|uniref:Oidioi.mRNA.OKI2018_I69.chr1.g2616.t1.cds n=1 Tax=Oikopleura dioica TaxID=34765 RepID=A0ABN7SRN2_OIKDI|nr:Oidioi.mRNA.OKI2018_I69.chr1.g2616.t1.cds [Oikopleura dioica]